MNYKCKFCLIRSSEKMIYDFNLKEEEKDQIVNELFTYISNVDANILTPVAAREINHIVANYTKIYDSHLELKKISNDLALQQYDDLKKKVLQSDNSYDTALRLSIAGNIMDVAAVPDFSNNSQKYFNNTVNKVLTSDFAIDDSLLLKNKINESKTILFLGDNAGEIVMDKLFLETIKHPNVYYAVKGNPVMNDATIKDARYVGIDKVVKVISNGYDAPSTILDKCSDEFMDIYDKADLIISKGQGNLEGLLNVHNKKIFFLLMIKCDVIGNYLGVKSGDFVVYNSKGPS